MTDPQGRKGQLEIIWQRSFRLLSLSSSFVDLCWEQRRILWQPGERLAAALSSGIVRAQVPASADHFNQLNATDTACCCEPSGPIQRGPQMDAAAEAFRQTAAANKCYVGWRWRRGGRWGSWDMQTTLRQPVCKGMLVPLSSPSISLQGLHSTSDMICGWWTFV